MKPAEIVESWRDEDVMLRIVELPRCVVGMLTGEHDDGTPYWQRIEYSIPPRVGTYATVQDWITGPGWGSLELSMPLFRDLMGAAKNNKLATPYKKAAELLKEHGIDIEAAPGVDFAASMTTGERGKDGRPSGETVINDNSLGCRRRGKKNQVGTHTQWKLDRLARDFPHLHAEVAAGRMSCNAAAIAAGIIKVPTPFEVACKAVAKLNENEKAELKKLL